MTVRLISDRAMNTVISHEDGVKAAVQAEAEDIAREAKGNLARHRDTGNASISVTDGDVDAFVNLDDPAALSIEFGHFVKGKYERDTPKYVPGLYILTGAAGLLNTL